jgi:pimeloyl-ACP methyl ester carboxylesterase
MTTTPLAVHRSGTGPPVVLLHPAGFGAAICLPLAARLAGDVEVILPDRRGYGARASAPPPDSLDDASDDLARLLDDLHLDQVTVVGVSAGATLTLAFALRHPDRVVSGLSHEPLLGPLAPELDAIVGARIATLLAEPDDDVAQTVPVFMSELVGITTWNHLRPETRDDVRRNAVATRHEVGLFPSFAVDHADIGRLATRGVISSVGALSGPARHEVAAVLSGAGMRVKVIPDAGHLAFVDALDAFADLVIDVADIRVVS